MGYIDASESVNPLSKKKKVTLIDPKHAPRRSSSASSLSSLSSLSSSDDETDRKPKRLHKKKAKQENGTSQVGDTEHKHVTNGDVNVIQETNGDTKVVVVKRNEEKSCMCTIL